MRSKLSYPRQGRLWVAALPLLFACTAGTEGIFAGADDTSSASRSAPTVAPDVRLPDGSGAANGGAPNGTAEPEAGAAPLAGSLADASIYLVYVPIFSASGRLTAVTSDLPRIAGLGFTTLFVMPVTPIGTATNSHPAFGSPYAVADYYSIAPSLGTAADFTALIDRAHALGMQVILDVVLNHTAWTNPLVNQHPEYYVHTDGNSANSNSIAQAFTYADVAQLDYKTSGNGLYEYMQTMLQWWMRTYHVDGFRFDSADNPAGAERMIPAPVWAALGNALMETHPNVILLGEEQSPDLARKPFNLDYGWSLNSAVEAATADQSAAGLRTAQISLKADFPAGALHTSMMQNWDMDADLRRFHGADGTLVAAIFNFTIDGVPLLFAGEEVGNDNSSNNTRTVINWYAPLSQRFSSFYAALGALRRSHAALRTGTTDWLPAGNSAVAAFTRTGISEQFFVAINFCEASVQTPMPGTPDMPWKDVTPPGAGHAAGQRSSVMLQLGPWDFAIFMRPL